MKFRMVIGAFDKQRTGRWGVLRCNTNRNYRLAGLWVSQSQYVYSGERQSTRRIAYPDVEVEG